MYVGLRADEEGRVGIEGYTWGYSISYPMREWEWDLHNVESFLRKEKIDIPKRTDCGACFFQRLYEWKELLEKYPERYQRYVDIEERIGYTFRSAHRDTWPASLYELREEFRSGRKVRTRTMKRSSKCRFCSM